MTRARATGRAMDRATARANGEATRRNLVYRGGEASHRLNLVYWRYLTGTRHPGHEAFPQHEDPGSTEMVPRAWTVPRRPSLKRVCASPLMRRLAMPLMR